MQNISVTAGETKVLKDIYSPLEIDEQWDQRAPMGEGDSAPADPTAVPSTEATGTTPTVEPATNETPDMPQAPEAANEVPEQPTNPDLPATPDMPAEPKLDMPDPLDADKAPDQANVSPDQANDDAAVSKFSGSDLEGDHVAEEATTDPADTNIDKPMDSMNPQPGDAVMPTETIEPKDEREQPEETAKEDEANTATVEPETTDVPENDTTAEHFVLGSQGDTAGEAKPEMPEESAVETPTEASLDTPVVPVVEPDVASEHAEALSAGGNIDEVIDHVRETLDGELSKLKTVKQEIADSLKAKEDEKSHVDTDIKDLRSKDKQVDEEITKIESVLKKAS